MFAFVGEQMSMAFAIASKACASVEILLLCILHTVLISSLQGIVLYTFGESFIAIILCLRTLSLVSYYQQYCVQVQPDLFKMNSICSQLHYLVQPFLFYKFVLPQTTFPFSTVIFVYIHSCIYDIGIYFELGTAEELLRLKYTSEIFSFPFNFSHDNLITLFFQL